jgi:eukaryotic-like serine/threonine-protein kinase
MDLQATQPQHAPEPRGGSAKFTYPSGSRPLEGYTIKRGVGQGGFGEVYYATSDAGKEVAIKLIRRNLDVELRGVSQCINLKHPSLLALYDIKQDDRGDSWVVMEYVAGESLEDVLAAHPNGLPVDEAMTWFHGIARGVAYLHDRGIVHRDLKPGNIFNDEGQVKIGDYGLSKFISASRRSGQTESVGTVHYMAPEIANGRYGKEIDIYALGVILYEFLTGHVPFEGESVGEVLMKHLTAEPDLSPLAEPFRSVIARTLNKDPNQRIHSVAELLALLPAPKNPALRVSRRRVPVEVEAEIVAPAVDGRGHVAGAAQVSPTVAPLSPRVATVERPASDEEPIWRAMREAWFQLRDGYNRSNFNTPTKVLLWIVGIWFLLNYAWSWIPALIFGATTYAAYRIIRWFVLAKAGTPSPYVAQRAAPRTRPVPATPVAATPSPAVAGTPPAPRPVPRRSHVRRSQREKALPAMPVKTGREKVTEVIGSMLLSTVVSLAACVVMFVIQGNTGYEQLAWLALVGTIGSWAVLIPSKFWEGTRGDPVVRRVVLMTMGLLVGLFAWGSAEALMVNVPPAAPTSISLFRHNEFNFNFTGFYDTFGQPTFRLYLAYFGLLFLIVRWWRQADPLRTSRLSIWCALVCVFWAGVLGYVPPFKDFPASWGMILAANTSIAVQLSSPWLDPRRRTARPAAAAA